MYRFKNKTTLIIFALIIAAAVIGGLLYVSHKKPAPTASPSTNSQTKGETKTDTTKGSSTSTEGTGQNTTPSNDKDRTGSTTETATLVAPSGSFVSTHYPSNGDVQIQSVCNTSPGASCSISFSQGNTVKQLETKTVDSSGTVYWLWQPNKLGLSSGKWHITATANLGDQTKSDNDGLDLEIPQ